MIGRTAAIKGRVAGAFYARSSNGRPTFLNLGRDYRKILVRIVPVVAVLAAFEIAVGALDGRSATVYLAAFSTGFVVAVPVFLWIAEPGHVRNWWMGAEGERATEAELETLGAEWSWDNGVELGRGDIDHVLEGPAGTFVLETKHFAGTISLVSGELVQTHDELPDRPRSWGWVRGATISKAIDLSRRSRDDRGRGRFVHAVVVIWGDFPQELVEEEHIAYVHGPRLAQWLRSRAHSPGRMKNAA
jgi:hypothetical protein